MTPRNSDHENLPASLLGDPRVGLAAERTFLAWIRTGLALMGFGFVVARFGLFLREVAAIRSGPAAGTAGFSLWLGTTLVALGVVAVVLAAVNHARLLRALEAGHAHSVLNTWLGQVMAACLAAIGVATMVYLLAIR